MGSRVRKSRELFEQALNYMPGGVQSARRPRLFFEEYPIFMERAHGSHVWDVDGNEYIDWMQSYGPVILGHCYPKVDQAVLAEDGARRRLLVVEEAEKQVPWSDVGVMEPAHLLQRGLESHAAAQVERQPSPGRTRAARELAACHAS